MWELIAGIAVPLIKWIFGKIANKKLSDKEFITYVTAHQKKISHAGDTAMDWEEALAKAQEELNNPPIEAVSEKKLEIGNKKLEIGKKK